MTTRELLAKCWNRGATIAVEGDRLRVRAPGPLPPALLAELRARKDAILTELERPLSLAEAQAIVTTAFVQVAGWYTEGALGELERDAMLAGRFRESETAIDLVAVVPGGPTAAELWRVLAAHVAVIRTCCERQRRRKAASTVCGTAADQTVCD